MAKNTMIFTLLQKFISQEEILEILAEFGFEDTARKCNVPTLLNYIVGLPRLNVKVFVTLRILHRHKA